MKIHIVDGTYELFRAHFAQPTRLAPDGMHVSAIRGLIISLMSLINDEQVSHIAVAFDSSIKLFTGFFNFISIHKLIPFELTKQK